MRFCPFIAAVFLAAGCAHYQPQPLSPAAAVSRFEARCLDDPGLKAVLEQNACRPVADWPQRAWDLNDLTQAAFYFHPGLQVARAQWLVAVAGEITAGARPNPTVTVNPSYDSQIPGNYSPWLVPVSFDVPIETAGKRGKRLAEAAAAAESARWNFIATAWQIRRGVRAGLQDLNAADKRANVLAGQFVLQKKIVNLLRGRFAAGEISRPELVAAEIALNQTQLDLSDAESARAAARSNLAQALGLDEAALAGRKFEFEFPAVGLEELTALTSWPRWRITPWQRMTCSSKWPGNIRTCTSGRATRGTMATRAITNGRWG